MFMIGSNLDIDVDLLIAFTSGLCHCQYVGGCDYRYDWGRTLLSLSQGHRPDAH